MRISACNQLNGTIISIEKGATTGHVGIDLGGTIVTASISNEAIDALGLTIGGKAEAMIKASDVMVSVE